MDHDSYSDGYIRGILNSVKSIAMVGASERENRPSYFAFKYLLERGYTMIPVNPGQAGETILVPTIGARARVLVGEVLPRLAVGAVVFAYRAPGPLTDVRPDRFPVAGRIGRRVGKPCMLSRTG